MKAQHITMQDKTVSIEDVTVEDIIIGNMQRDAVYPAHKEQNVLQVNHQTSEGCSHTAPCKDSDNAQCATLVTYPLGGQIGNTAIDRR